MDLTGKPLLGIPRIQVFRPTYDEFKDFSSFITYMESQGAHKAGIAKVIPPPEWKPRKQGYDLQNLNVTIPAPICQVVTGKQGLYQQINITKKSMTVQEYRKLAESPRYCTPRHFDYEDLERKYWKNITYIAPIYGADVSGSLTDTDETVWNINHLGTVLDFVNEDYGISIDGVNTAYLYFGMWKTTFAWHTEDMDLYSINYLHFGAPKTWYGIPPEHGRRLERLANGFFPSNFKLCPAFLRHKMTVISPHVLRKYSIPFNKITQEQGEIMITFPYGYHAGFNHGFNCAESTNFASTRWVEYGKRASQCSCRPDNVKISMDTFVKRFQPDRYDLWLQGKDIGPHPEDPSRLTAAPAPKEEDILCNKNNPEVPTLYFETGKKRIPSVKKSKIDIPLEVKRVIDELDLEEEAPDEEQLEALEDIWLKAGEMELEEATIYDDGYNVNKRGRKKKNIESSKTGRKIKKEKKEKRKRDLRDIIIHDKEDPEFSLPMTKEEKIKKTVKKEETELDETNIIPSKPKQADFLAQFVKFMQKKEDTKRKSRTRYELTKERKRKKEAELAKVSENKVVKIEPLKSESEINLAINTHLKDNIKVEDATNTNTDINNYHTISDHMYALQREPAPSTSLTTTNSYSIKGKKIQPRKNSAKLCITQQSMYAENLNENQQSINNVKNNDNTSYNLTFHSDADKLSRFQSANKSVPTPSDIMSYKVVQNQDQSLNDHDKHILNLDRGIVISETSACRVESIQQLPISLDNLHQQYLHSDNGLSFNEPSTSSWSISSSTTSQNLTAPDLIHMDGNWSQNTPQFNDENQLSLLTSNVGDLEVDRQYNRYNSHHEPHCSLCVLFTSHKRTKIPQEWRQQEWSKDLPAESHVYLPSGFQQQRSRQIVRSSPLLVCVRCYLCVHTVCYPSSDVMAEWLCDKCSANEHFARCCLCIVRGGALRRTSDSRWAHILCAIFLPDISFLNKNKDVIELGDLLTRHECSVCNKNTGSCVRCCDINCGAWYHVTCAMIRGSKFRVNPNAGAQFLVTCKDHPHKHDKLCGMQVGQWVWAQHQNRRYYKGKIINVTQTLFYMVSFPDGSLSDKVYPNNVLDMNGSETPNIGTNMTIQWVDGAQYQVQYQGSSTKAMYMIEFEDSTILHLSREEIYSLDDELPKRLRNRLLRLKTAQKKNRNNESDSKKEIGILPTKTLIKKENVD